MVDLTVAPASVLAQSGASHEKGIAGGTVTAGQLVWLDETLNPNRYKLVDTNDANLSARKPRGIALHGASNGQPLEILRSGDIVIGATMVAGDAYYASDTPGGICPRADVGTTENVALIGLARSTTVLAVDIQIPGVVL